MSDTLQTLLIQYNALVSSIDDLEKALATLIGSADWETNVVSNTKKSVQILYTELKAERATRQTMEAQNYNLVTP